MLNKFIIIAAGAVALFVMSSNSVQAQSYEFRYTGAELSSVTAAADVYSRIHQTATNLCDEKFGGQRLVTHQAEYDRCVRGVVKDIVSDINNPYLNEIHKSQR